MESFGMKSKARLKDGSIPSIFPFQEQKNERVSSQSRLQKRKSLEKKGFVDGFIALHNGLSFLGPQYPCVQTLNHRCSKAKLD